MASAFVIQIHSGYGDLHYDLMLERGKVLATWQLSLPPGKLHPGQALSVRKLPDHRLAYLTYEGPISGRRGEVKILDSGSFELLRCDERQWTVKLDGGSTRGRFELIREEGDAWTLRRGGKG